MQTNMIVGLSGYARSGKDTVAGFMQEFGFRKIAFADKLREAIAALDPMLSMMIDGETGEHTMFRVQKALARFGYEGTKEAFPEYRRLLQCMGTEVGRQLFGEDFWVEQTLRTIRNSSTARWVIADCRFRNEADAIRKVGGLVVRVHRPGVTAVNDHISEHDLDDYAFDFLLSNEGSLDILKDDVRSFVRTFLE